MAYHIFWQMAHWAYAHGYTYYQNHLALQAMPISCCSPDKGRLCVGEQKSP
jgi:hypothetical protein